SSTPSVIQALRGRHPQTYRELTPVCAVIGDYLAFVVRRQSEVASWEQLVAGFKATPAVFKFAGGSVLGGFDHLGTALALEAAGADIVHLAYVPYDTGGKAMAALLSGETPLLATGVGEAMGAWRAEQVRVLAVSAPVRISALPEVPTLRELGTGVELVNWRGFFGPPGLDEAAVSRWIGLLRDMAATPEWRALVERNGWVEILRCGDDFTGFLAAQEAALAPLLRRLDSRSSRSARRTAGG
ncbi:MAG: tripartite tricarboxylate transporter substrate binding protein, partial [Thermoanaerobaculia bacterium]|nr:tripartite tricarboxylate transporter substrate binding protein [Thermoanaerobaculia bacterium]